MERAASRDLKTTFVLQTYTETKLEGKEQERV